MLWPDSGHTSATLDRAQTWRRCGHAQYSELQIFRLSYIIELVVASDKEKGREGTCSWYNTLYFANFLAAFTCLVLVPRLALYWSQSLPCSFWSVETNHKSHFHPISNVGFRASIVNGKIRYKSKRIKVIPITFFIYISNSFVISPARFTFKLSSRCKYVHCILYTLNCAKII